MEDVDWVEPDCAYIAQAAEIREMDREMHGTVATNGCPKQFHIVLKTYYTPKSKGQGICLQGLHA